MGLTALLAGFQSVRDTPRPKAARKHGSLFVLVCRYMGDMNALREKISDVASAVRSIDTNPNTPDKAAYSVRKGKEALEKIVEILKDIVTALESK
jgi:hypothetical protein